MGHPIHKHMHTHITKQNVKAAIRDDKAHMDYLKRDIRDDQRAGGKYKDINQTADEKHISKLAGDVRYDEKKEGVSRHTSAHSTEEYLGRRDAAIRKSQSTSPVNNITYGDKSGPTGYIGEERYDLNRYNPVDDRAGMSRNSYSGNQPFKKKKKPSLKDLQSKEGSGPRVGDVKPGTITPTGGSPYKDKKKKGSPAKFDKMSKKQAEEHARVLRTEAGKATKKDKRKNKREHKRTMRHVKKHGSGLIMD